MGDRPTVLVLGGGPDAERSVSIDSAHNVAQALRAGECYTVIERTIDMLNVTALRVVDSHQQHGIMRYARPIATITQSVFGLDRI